MARYSAGDATWREGYRRVSKTVSIPKYLMDDIEAHGKPSTIITDILETHKDAIGDGIHLDLIRRRKERIALLVEEALKEKMLLMVREVVREAVDDYVDGMP